MQFNRHISYKEKGKDYTYMLERFLKQTTFKSMEDFCSNLEFKIPETFNFAIDVMDAWAEEAPDKLAMLWTNDHGAEIRYTFKDLKEESDRAATFFQSLGIGKGDPVMLILKRRHQFWTSVLALNKLGAVTIPATFLLTAKDIIYRCESASIKAIVCCGDDDILEHVDKAMPDCSTLQKKISIGPIVPEGWEDFNTGVADANPMTSYPSHSIHEPMLMYFTSGTSGEPKMVLHDNTYAIGHITTGAYWHNLHENSLHLTIADTGWGKAAWGKLYGQWIAGATVFVYDHEKFTPSDILKKIEQYKVTSLCAPPTIFRFMIRENLSKYDLSSLEYCTTAGEALNGAVYNKFFEGTGIHLMEGFGQTETTLIIGTFPWMKPKPGSMGKPNPQYDVVLMKNDESLEPVTEPGKIGQIAIRTNHKKPLGLFCEYYRNEELTNSVWHDGLYFTGDLAYFDEDGYYWFVGRADDVIKSSGYRIGPFEVESALMTHPAVVECAITGVPDPIRGEVVKATIVLGNEWVAKAGEELIKDLQDHVKRETAPYKYPRVIEFVDELPKTVSGKIKRNEIRQKDHGER